MSKSESLYGGDFINLYGNLIHKTAIIHDSVQLGKGNIIGAYTVIGSNGEMRKPKDFKGSIKEFQNHLKALFLLGMTTLFLST